MLIQLHYFVKKKMNSIYKTQEEEAEKKKDLFVKKYSKCIKEFQISTIDKKIEIFKEMLEIFEEYKDIIYFKYNSIKKQVIWLKFKNMILCKCLEFKNNISMKELCNAFIKKHFICTKITTKKKRCTKIIKPISTTILCFLLYMIELEKKQKKFTIEEQEMKELSEFRNHEIELCYCSIHTPKEFKLQ